MTDSHPKTKAPILLTTGEPAGIGPDLVISLLQHPTAPPLWVVADPDLLLERAALLGLPLTLNGDTLAAPGGQATLLPVSVHKPVVPGRLDVDNAAYVVEMLQVAANRCQQGEFGALVTGPVQKSVLIEAGNKFVGHTEFLGDQAGGETPVMMLVRENLRVALVTIHIPLADVAGALTGALLERVLRVVDADLRSRFAVDEPRIGVCGLNPHAGESGHLGREEIDTIVPVLKKLIAIGLDLKGPLPADTAFTPPFLSDLDVVVAMFHDQGLPVIKHAGFGEVVNVTLGLPYIRTSVDHGTALNLAGTGRAAVGSLVTAVKLARRLTGAS